MLEIDGSTKSGSGTILRLSIALATINQEPLHIFNIRHNRRQRGLRPQHLESVNTAAKLCNADIEGVKVGSRELWFKPNDIMSGEVTAKIGTAGSISMLLLTILPICAYAKGAVQVNVINGGTDVRFAPTINYLKYILLPTLEKMGLNVSLKIKKFGYYPKGLGEVSLKINPVSKLNPLQLDEFGEFKEIKGVSVCTFLEQQRVAERQAQAATKLLSYHGYTSQIRIVNDQSNPFQRGSSLILWAKTNKEVLLGGDAIGKIRKSSEAVGEESAENLLKEIKAKATVDVHLADILIPYIGLTKGSSSYMIRKMTEHLDTNIWLIDKILDRKIFVTKEKNLYKVST
ncbi:RNA 3'-terminal phosphate cyclase [Candidatus Bathyarchaeota archaeon]|nr:RNA 3'-terminal phosphate cyclase [Candidatus Bathyarchaeota archaeon]